MASNDSHSKTILAALLIGFVGAVLFAPQSGKDARQRIKDKAGKFRSKAEDKVEDVKSSMDQELKDAESKVKEIQERMKKESQDESKSSLLARWTKDQ